MKDGYWLAAIISLWVGGQTHAQKQVPSVDQIKRAALVRQSSGPVHDQVKRPAHQLIHDSAKIKPNIKLNECEMNFVEAKEVVKAYANELESRLKNKSAGYAFVVRYRDSEIIEERAGGAARRYPDSNPRAMSVNDRLNIASVSKTFTAVALIKLLIMRDISIDSPIYELLPPNWTLGDNFETVTYREILTHRSGIQFPNPPTLEALETGVEQGVLLADKGIFFYNNSNFALMRILIARLAIKDYDTEGPNAGQQFGYTYIQAVNRQVFRPAGVSDIRCQPDAEYPALCYQFPDVRIGGTDFGNCTEVCGPVGWNMSARELSQVGSTLLFSSTNAILPSQQVDLIVNEELGIFKDMLSPTATAFGHNGYYPGKDDQGNILNCGELNSLLIGFSNGVSVALLINSQLSSTETPTANAKQAMAVILKRGF